MSHMTMIRNTILILLSNFTHKRPDGESAGRICSTGEEQLTREG